MISRSLSPCWLHIRPSSTCRWARKDLLCYISTRTTFEISFPTVHMKCNLCYCLFGTSRSLPIINVDVYLRLFNTGAYTQPSVMPMHTYATDSTSISKHTLMSVLMSEALSMQMPIPLHILSTILVESCIGSCLRPCPWQILCLYLNLCKDRC
jgi:hypothetical protein